MNKLVLKQMGYKQVESRWIKPVGFFIFVIQEDNGIWLISQVAMSATDETLFTWKTMEVVNFTVKSIQGYEAYCGRNMWYWGDNPNTDKLVPQLTMMEQLEDFM